MLNTKPWVAAIAGAAATGLLPAAAETRAIEMEEPFHGVLVARGVEASFAAGPAVAIEAGGDDLSRLEAFVDDGTLIIRRAGPFSDAPARFRVSVIAPGVHEFKVATGGVLTAVGLDFERGEAIADTGGEMSLSGVCGHLTAKAETGGQINASALVCRTAKAKARTGGEADVHATEEVFGYARLGGEVRVHGGGTLAKRGRFLGGEVRSVD